MRQAIFNILGPPSPDAPVLDLYAGTGALGIEALSRGAPRATFVERDGRALAALGRNLRELELDRRAVIMGSSVDSAIERLGATRDGFLWVFVDPPYASAEAERTLGALAGSPALASGAVIIVEHDKRNVPPDASGELRLVDRRYYGDTGVSFFRRSTSLA